MATRRRASKSTLTGNITDLQRRVRYLQAKPVPSRLANQVVTRSAIQPRAVDTDQIALRAITNDQVAADAIKQEQLDALSVGNPELQDNAVLNRNIARDAVNQESIEINSVGNEEMRDDSVGRNELQDDAVGRDEIADDAVGRDQIGIDAVGNNELDDNSVNTNQIVDRAVTAAKIADNTITVNQIGSNAVDSDELVNLAVTRDKIRDRAVNVDKLADSAVTTNKINNLAVTTGKIAEGGVTFAKIASGASQSIVQTGLGVGTGLIATATDRLNVGVLFGTGSNQVPRGNHIHTMSTSDSNQRIIVVGGDFTFALSNHRHTIFASSKRYKKDISKYDFGDPKKLLKLEPVKYKYKRSKREGHQETNREWDYGYIAEDVLATGLHEIVGYNREGEVEGLDYGRLSVFLVELLKEHQSEIDFLKKEIDKLRNDNAN
jgi:hypothetical protein